MDLSRAYGSNFTTQSLGSPAPTTLPTDEIVPVQVIDGGDNGSEVPKRPRRSRNREVDVYKIHIEIGRDDAHLLCMFIAALILSLVFTSRK